LDGARIFNAAVKLKLPVKELCRGFDSVSACLSKGLGAPAGTMLMGTTDFIARARRARKILGGVMRQAGILAAAGLYALEHNVERLADDHANAERLARGIGAEPPQSNMVFVQSAPGLVEHLAKHGVIVLPAARLRLVTHLDVDAAGIERAIAAFQSFRREAA
jgi:threonine aldolase